MAKITGSILSRISIRKCINSIVSTIIGLCLLLYIMIEIFHYRFLLHVELQLRDIFNCLSAKQKYGNSMMQIAKEAEDIYLADPSNYDQKESLFLIFIFIIGISASCIWMSLNVFRRNDKSKL